MNEKLRPADWADGFLSIWSPSILSRLTLFAVCSMFSHGAIAFSAACNDNIKTVCGDVVPGAYRLTSCLIENQSRLSLACRSAVFVSIERGADFNKSSKQDVSTLCPNIASGYGRIYSCLVLQEKLVSPRCRSHLGSMTRP